MGLVGKHVSPGPYLGTKTRDSRACPPSIAPNEGAGQGRIITR
jgi:hypothetical protein